MFMYYIRFVEFLDDNIHLVSPIWSWNQRSRSNIFKISLLPANTNSSYNFGCIVFIFGTMIANGVYLTTTFR